MRISKVSPESPLRLRPIATALADSSFEIHERAISKRWFYSGVLPVSLTGFNPHLDGAYIAKDSRVADWLKNPKQSARPHNKADHLLVESLYLAHDYLHNWAYRAIRALYPKLEFGTGPIDNSRFEDYVFCHLVTEAAAVVGLDYWYLANVNIDEVCPIGAARGNLTVPYHESMAKECRRFNPQHKAQRPEFFGEIAKFYASGEFLGFGRDAIEQSPLVYNWLGHEIAYGETQRIFTRRWLYHMRAGALQMQDSDLAAPVRVSKRWQRDLLIELSKLLWNQVRTSKSTALPAVGGHDGYWRSKNRMRADFRFVNLNRNREITSVNNEESRRYRLYQLVSQREFSSVDPARHKPLADALARADESSVFKLLRGSKLISSSSDEPFDVFLLN